MSADEPRPQHYLFAHRALPQIIHDDPGKALALLTGPEADTFLSFFWERVGQNMREPRFVLGSTWVDVITRDAAVMTLTYSIPHRTPAGNMHVVSGAWTMFWRRIDGRWVIVQEHLSDTPESTRSSVPDTTGLAARSTTADTPHRH